MSKLTRVHQKQFGVDGPTTDFGQFGSMQTGTKITTKDPATIQALNNFTSGWVYETIFQNRPALEDFNGLDFLKFYQLCYLFQAGIPEWHASCTYYIGSIVNSDGELYVSLVNDNLNHAVTETDYWRPFTASQTAVQNSFRNLSVTRPSVSTVTVTADELVLKNTSGESYNAQSVNVTANIASSGANGLDSGTEAANTIYRIWVIRKSSDGTVSALLSISASSPTMPSGYDQKALVGTVGNNNSSDFINFIQKGRKYAFVQWGLLRAGTSLNDYNHWHAITLSALSSTQPCFVDPELSSHCWGSFFKERAYILAMTNDNTVATSSTGDRNKLSPIGDSEFPTLWKFDILTSDTLYWLNQSHSYNKIYLAGFELNKL